MILFDLFNVYECVKKFSISFTFILHFQLLSFGVYFQVALLGLEVSYPVQQINRLLTFVEFVYKHWVHLVNVYLEGIAYTGFGGRFSGFQEFLVSFFAYLLIFAYFYVSVYDRVVALLDM